MTIEEAKRKRPCCECKHYAKCQVVDWLYSPCYRTDEIGNDHHGAFEPKDGTEESED